MPAILARTAKNHVVRGHRVTTPVRDALDRGLEAGVLEGLDLAAVVAHEVMVMVAARMSRLEACDPVAEIDPLHEPELVHAFERPVHARDPHAFTLRSNRVVDLLRRKAAVLLAEEHDDAPPCAAAAAACIA